EKDTEEKPKTPKKGEVKKPEPTTAQKEKDKEKEKPKPKVEAPPILVKRVTDSDLATAWEAWRVAQVNMAANPDGEAKARTNLLTLKDQLGADLEPWSAAML